MATHKFITTPRQAHRQFIISIGIIAYFRVMKPFRALIFALILSSLQCMAACHSKTDKKPEDPNKAPMFRPLHHSQDSANA